MGATEDIDLLLRDADEQLEVAAALHDPALEDNAARGRFRTRVKNVLENQRSALDYLAVAITERYGHRRGLTYYPLAQSQGQLKAEIDSKMPGVRVNRPDIAEAIARHQPYDQEWLQNLSRLTREQKHNRLSVQLVREVYQCRVTEVKTGAFVQWHGLRFKVLGSDGTKILGAIESDGGAVEIRPEPGRSESSPKPFWVGVGPTCAEVFGVPINPETQQPFPHPGLRVESGPLHQWCFLKPHAPVLTELGVIQSALRKAVDDILAVSIL